jgi:hypothetical protein
MKKKFFKKINKNNKEIHKHIKKVILIFFKVNNYNKNIKISL